MSTDMQVDEPDEYAQFDEAVIRTLNRDFPRSLSENATLMDWDLTLILEATLETAAIEEDRRNATCSSLVADDFSKIRSAIRARKFYPLLAIAPEPSNRQSYRGGGPFFEKSAEGSEATSSAWDVEYSGESHNVLEATIHDMNNTRRNKPYANFLPIIQSSGMGKSRTVDELAKFVFTLPFNFRAAKEKSGFPLPDDTVRDFFKVQGRGSNRETHTELRCRYLAFLTNLFAAVQDMIFGIPKQNTHARLASSWRYLLSQRDSRRMLYDEVLQRDRSKWVTEKEATLAAEQSVQSLLKSIHEWSGTKEHDGQGGPVRLLLYFDESHNLTDDLVEIPASISESSELDTQCSAYQTLCWALDQLQSYAIFAIFLSTNSHLARLSLRSRHFSSDRSRDAPFTNLNTPFVELPFDVWTDASGVIVHENKHTLDSICKDEFMVRFGRPLFWTRYFQGSNIVKHDIVNFAITKVTGLPLGKSPEDDVILAALGIRLLLEFQPGRQAAIDAEDRLVAGHMRVAYSVPAHREYMRSGAPSEPILAEAASRIMAGGIKVLDVLSRFVGEGLVGKGERGELVARLLMILAHDRAVLTLAARSIPRGSGDCPGPPLNPANVRYSTGIPLITFLEALVGELHLQTIIHSRPDNIAAGVTFEEAFADARVHFTHWAKAGDSSPVSDDAAWKSMCRGMVFQCFDQQADIDFIIPVLLKSNALLGRYVMTAILVQIKDSSKKQAVHINAENLHFFSPGTDEDNRRPYITLTMELGVQPRPPPQGRLDAKQRTKVPTTTTPSKVWVSKGSSVGSHERAAKKTKRVVHPRYAISITGCSSRVYRVIAEDETYTYAGLLGSRSLLDEHPRKDAIRHLKPMWWFGASWAWAADAAFSLTSQSYTNPELREGVSTGQYDSERDEEEEIEDKEG